MCEMNFSVEIGGEQPKLIVRSGSLGQAVMQIPLRSIKEIDKLALLLEVARQQLEETQK